ncbi:hypothetical protein ONZ45_g8613 [Pleurotus djamor]|nr:hypothetical protein ONZ45_g8613 [Pleurotus djamor]
MKSDPLANPQLASENLRRSQELQDRVKQLSEDIEGILTRAHEVLEGNVVSRFFRSNMDADTLQALDKEVQQAQSRFQLKGAVSIEMVVNELIATTQAAELDRQLGKLRTVDAGYRAPVNARKSRWLEGTRTQLLQDIVDWSHGHGSDQLGCSGGSFFFERGVEELSSTRHVFPTLAVQLARSHKYLAPYIVKGITKHQDKGNTQNLTYALDELVVEPLSEVPEDQRPSQPLVFVLDALDECSEQSQVPALLYALLKRIRSLPFPLRLFVTSRPEYHIQDAFASLEWESEPQPYQLTSIPLNIVRDDIRRFIDVRATEIGIAQKLKTAQADAIERLTDAAGGLFIFASTALEFLARYQRDLGKTLKLVLNHPLNVDTLDALYDVVLRNAFSENDFRHPDLGPAIPLVLGVLAVVQDQLAPQHLDALLQMDHATLSEVLDRLQSVLTFSEDHPIRLLHASFPQYLVDPERCKLPKISNNPSFRGHDYLARQCLKVLLDGDNLKRNICDLADPLVFRNDIPDLNECLTQSIPPSRPVLLPPLETKMLYWMEALAMLGRIDAVVSMLARTLQWHKVDDQTRFLLNDGYRFVLNFMDAMTACPFHIYASGLPFSPTKSLLRKFYMHQADDSCAVDVLAGLDEGWGACLQVMEGHRTFIRHVTFSHNGQWIASTSDDPEFYIWNSSTGILLHRISGHLKAVVTALFSSDDNTVFSGSLDSTIMIWNTVSGAPLKVIQLDAPVQSMALSSAAPDIPQKIAVASRYYGPMYPGEEGMVTKILDIDGQILKTLPEGLGRCIDWSVDNKYFALAEREKVVVYTTQTYEVWKELVGPSADVTVVKLFPQSDFLASGASDYTVRLWQLASQTCIHVFEGHTGYLRGIAINPQKGLLVSTALDRSMRVWSLAEKTCVSVHSVPDSITRLSFSPDGEMLVSGDLGHMLRSWDVNEPAQTPLFPAIDWVISPDARLMAARELRNGAGRNDQVELWSIRDDRLVAKLSIGKHLRSILASTDGPWFALLTESVIYRINIVTQETSYLTLGLVGEGLKHPRWDHILSLTGSGGVSTDGRLIYLQIIEYNAMFPPKNWYILDWQSEEIKDVDQEDVPPEYCGAEGPLSLAPIPELSVAAGALLRLVEMVQKTRNNKEECLQLAQSLNSLATFLESTSANIEEQMKSSTLYNPQTASSSLRRSEELQDRVKQLSEDTESILARAHGVLEGNVVSRFFRSSLDAETLQLLDKEVQQAQSRFQLKGTVSIEIVVNELIATSQAAELDHQLGKLRTVDAGYRAPVNARKSRWLEGTRTQLLQDIVDWSHGHGSDEVRANAHVFVLTGGAGTGKSTIAVQVAKMFDEVGVLGGSFFFERGVEELSSTRYIFPTLAVQLARSHKYLAPYIIRGIAKHLNKGTTQNMAYALDELIVEPLSQVSSNERPSQPLVFVLDALDECSEQDQVPGLLYLLLKRIRSLPFPLRLFVTSRPEYHIQDAFASVEWESEPRPYQLTSIPMNIVRSDIKQFIEVRSTEIGIAHKLKTVREDTIERLTDAAAGLFIFASTALEFLGRYQRDLGKTLELVLNHPLNVDTLDALYSVVLQNAFSNNDFRHPDLGPAIPVVLGVLAVIQDQLAPQDLSTLLQLDRATLNEVLCRLESVLTFSEDNPIRLLHASFPQYFVDPKRCRLPNISDEPSFRGDDFLAIQCLTTLLDSNSLRRNICDLKDPLVFRSDIPDLNGRLLRSIPSHVQYSCLYWATHLCNSTPTPELTRLLGEFTETKMLCWMEALGMLGRIDAAVSMLTRTLRWHKVDNRTRILLNDGYRFVLTFMDAIKTCPFQVYASGLPFSPTTSLLREVYSHQFNDPSVVNVLAGLDETWGACLRVMEGHKHIVDSVAFSHNGRWIASASFDYDVKVWDAAGGMLLRTLSGHTDRLSMTVFSSDDNTILSGSYDKTIRVWNTASGAPLKTITLDGSVRRIILPFGPVNTERILVLLSPGVEVSPSLSFIQILDNDGHVLETPPLRLTHPESVDWSLNNKYLAIAPAANIILYDTDTYSVLGELVGHQDDVTGLKIVPQSSHLVSGSVDRTIRVWDVEARRCIHVFEGHTRYVHRITVSPVNGLVASSSWDNSLRIWSLQEKTCVATHTTTSNCIMSLSFSPDGEYLVSGDLNSMLQLWDVHERPKATSVERDVVGWVISPDGRFMATKVAMGQAEVWSMKEDRLVASVRVDESDDPPAFLHALVTSGDGLWVALVFPSSTIHLINTITEETSSLSLDPQQHPRWTSKSVRNLITGRGGITLDGKFIYLRCLEDVDQDGVEAQVPRWYILNWQLQQIADVAEEDVPSEYFRPSHQRYVQHDGWFVDRWQNRHLCWMPPAFRSEREDTWCCLYEDSFAAKYFSISTSRKITVLDMGYHCGGQESDEWKSLYKCLERKLGRA